MGRMRLGGIALICLAGVMLFVAVFVPFPVGSRTVLASTAWTISSDSWSSVSVTIAWSANASATEVYVVTAAPSCNHPTNVVASGAGADGSLSTQFRTGVTYDIYACSGSNWETGRFSLSSTGTPDIAEPLEVIGAIAALFGVFLVLRKPPVPPSHLRFARHRP